MRRSGPGLQFLLGFHGKSLLIAVLIYCLSARLTLFPSARGHSPHDCSGSVCLSDSCINTKRGAVLGEKCELKP